MGKIFASCIPLIRLQEDLPSLRHILMLRYLTVFLFFVVVWFLVGFLVFGFFGVFLIKERVPLQAV